MNKNTLLYVGIGGALAYWFFSNRTAAPAAVAVQSNALNAATNVQNAQAIANLTSGLAQSADTIASFW
jgi:hypothetical protein